MWTRSEVKDNTKQVMKRSYWTMFKVALVASLLCGEVFNFSNHLAENTTKLSFNFQGFHIETNISEFIKYIPNASSWMTFLTIFSIVGIVIGFVYSIFIANPIEYGKCKYFLENRKRESRFHIIFAAFGSHYWNIVKILCIRDIKVFLWTLLFVFPGIYKSYEYRMIPYLLADNPDISVEEAFAGTRALTQGQKFEIFILDLSFLGWDILGMLLFFLGSFFINPYKEGCYAELYSTLCNRSEQY